MSRVLLTFLFLSACGVEGSKQPDHTEDAPDSGTTGTTDSGPDLPDASPSPDGGALDPTPDSGPDLPDASVPTVVVPKVIVDDKREVVKVEPDAMVITDAPRNQCSLGIGPYLIQHVAIQSTCGELADLVGDMTSLNTQFLSIAKDCTLGHRYNQDPQCTSTTEVTCPTPDGCLETRYTDFDWTPNTKEDMSWLGDGVVKLTRVCPGVPDCVGTYSMVAFPR